MDFGSIVSGLASVFTALVKAILSLAAVLMLPMFAKWGAYKVMSMFDGSSVDSIAKSNFSLTPRVLTPADYNMPEYRNFTASEYDNENDDFLYKYYQRNGRLRREYREENLKAERRTAGDY